MYGQLTLIEYLTRVKMAYMMLILKTVGVSVADPVVTLLKEDALY